MIQSIRIDAGAPTTAHGTWDPHVNAVSYSQANYTSETADGRYGDDSAQRVAERVDRIAAPQEQRR